MIESCALSGDTFYRIFLQVLGDVGGLFGPVSFCALVLVAYFEKPGFIASITKNIFMVTKYQGEIKKD